MIASFIAFDTVTKAATCSCLTITGLTRHVSVMGHGHTISGSTSRSACEKFPTHDVDFESNRFISRATMLLPRTPVSKYSSFGRIR